MIGNFYKIDIISDIVLFLIDEIKGVLIMQASNSYTDLVTVDNVGKYINVVGKIPFYSFLCNFSDSDIASILKCSESQVNLEKGKYIKALASKNITPFGYLFKYPTNILVNNSIPALTRGRLEEKLLIAYGFYLVMGAALNDTKVRYFVANRRGNYGIVEDWLKGWADEVVSNKTVIDYCDLKSAPNVYARGVKVCTTLQAVIKEAASTGVSNTFLDNLTKLKCVREFRETIWGAAVADLLTCELSGRVNDGWAVFDVLASAKPSGALQKGEKIPKPIITTRALKERLGIK